MGESAQGRSESEGAGQRGRQWRNARGPQGGPITGAWKAS